MLFLYEVKYQYTLSGTNNWVSDADLVVAGDNAADAVAEVEEAIKKVTVDMSDQDDGSDVRTVTAFTLSEVKRVSSVDKVHVPSLVIEGIVLGAEEVFDIDEEIDEDAVAGSLSATQPDHHDEG